jgi:hypothetical protein
MQRRTLDAILTAGGLILAIVLVVAGSLLTWGYKFADNNVHDQLAAQKIFFPPKGNEALAPKEIGPFLNQYAGQQLLDGKQAQSYADHFIAVHLSEVAGGKTYSEVSTLARANPTDAKLKGQVDTLFRGETLRGLLLNAYAFWKLGQIAKWAAIAAFFLAGVMIVLTILGIFHLRKVPETAEVRVPGKPRGTSAGEPGGAAPESTDDLAGSDIPVDADVGGAPLRQ